MIKDIKKGKRYRVKSNSNKHFNLGDIVVSLEDDSSVPYCVPENIYVKGNGLDNYPNQEYRAIANYKLDEIEQEEQPSNTEKKITISENDFKLALMVAMFDEGTAQLISKQPLLAMAFIVFGSQIEMNLFKEEKEDK